MARTSTRKAFGCILILVSSSISQNIPAPSPVRLKPLVLNAIERALPSPPDFSARIWQGRNTNSKLSRSDLEGAYAKAREGYRREALIQLQPVSDLFNQLNIIETLIWCATDVDHQLQELSKDALNPDPAWANVNASWTRISPNLECVSGDLPHKPQASSGQKLSLLADPEVRASLESVVVRVRKAAADLTSAVRMRDQIQVVYSARDLSKQMEMFYVVAALQLTILSKDLHGLVPTMGEGVPETPELVERLQNLLKDTPENK